MPKLIDLLSEEEKKKLKDLKNKRVPLKDKGRRIEQLIKKVITK